MDATSIFLSGLGGAAVGSVIALAGAFGIQLWQRRRDAQATARVLYFEVVTNATYLRGMAAVHFPLTDLSRATWDVTQSTVADLLGPDEIRTVAMAYGLLATSQLNIDLARARGGIASADLSVWAGGAQSFLEAADILRRRAWSPRDQAALSLPAVSPEGSRAASAGDAAGPA